MKGSGEGGKGGGEGGMTSSGWLMLMLTLTLLQHHRSRCPRGQRATAPSVGEPRKQACWPFVAAHTTLLPLCGGCSGHDLGWGTGRQVTSCLDRHESVPFPSFPPRVERRGDLDLRDLGDLVDYIPSTSTDFAQKPIQH